LWSESVGAEVLVFVFLGPWLLDALGSTGRNDASPFDVSAMTRCEDAGLGNQCSGGALGGDGSNL